MAWSSLFTISLLELFGFAAGIALVPWVLAWNAGGRALLPAILNYALAVGVVAIAVSTVIPPPFKIVAFPIWVGGWWWILSAALRARIGRARFGAISSRHLGSP